MANWLEFWFYEVNSAQDLALGLDSISENAKMGLFGRQSEA
jgi:hypothetical protein